MSIGSGIAIYFLLWWISLFVALPLRVKSQIEAGQIVPGSEAGAPEKPHLWWKLGVTTLVATALFVVVWAIMVFKPIPLSSIPIIGSV